jgi:hypothetical protein
MTGCRRSMAGRIHRGGRRRSSRRSVPPPRATPERVAELKKAYELRWSIKRPVNTARASRLEIGGPYDPV